MIDELTYDQLILEQNNIRLKLEELFPEITNEVFFDILLGLKINFISVGGAEHFSLEDLLKWAIKYAGFNSASNINNFFLINSCLDQNGYRRSIFIEGNQGEIFRFVERAIKLKVFL